MEQSPLERQHLIDRLSNRIQSGESLRQELSAVFDTSARSILGPVSDDMRAVSNAALEDLRRWREDVTVFVKHLEEQITELVRTQAAAMQTSQSELQDAVRVSVDGLRLRFNDEAGVWAGRYASDSEGIRSALGRMEPLLQDARQASVEMQANVASVIVESAEILGQISVRGMDEARRAAESIGATLQPMLHDLAARHEGAYQSFKTSTEEFLELQRKQTGAVATGLSDVAERLQQTTAFIERGLNKLSVLFTGEAKKGEEASRSFAASLAEAESRLTQLARRESERLEKSSRDMLDRLNMLQQMIHVGFDRISAEMAERNAKADRLDGIRFWVLASLVAVSGVVLANLPRH